VRRPDPGEKDGIEAVFGSWWRTVLPTFGWGKQSVWLAASSSQTLFAGRSPHPLSRPEELLTKLQKERQEWYNVGKEKAKGCV